MRWSGFLAAALVGCGGAPSALRPAGRDAERIAELFWWMAGGALVVWLAVIGLAVYAILFSAKRHDAVKTRLLVIGGGAVVPTVVLCVLLIFGLRMMPALLEAGRSDGPRIHVTGEQWWWRVRYELPDGTHFELANELWLPVGERVGLSLESRDVIHAFWVPALAGKVDMIPGRINHIALEPTRTGVFRGACAEYCGAMHAKMAFHVVVVEEQALADWLARQAAPAAPPATPAARRGEALFDALGCDACHTVRGSGFDGAIGPDLTHVGSRQRLAAGVLPNDVDGFATWLRATHRIKPRVHMPGFDMVPDQDVVALARYLEGLQ